MMNSGKWMMGEYSRGFSGDMWPRHMGGYDGFGPVSLLTLSVFSIIALIAVLWAVSIKGYALWHAAKRNEKWWFIALLVINTFGLFELVYILFFAKVWPRKSAEKIENNDQKAAEQHSGASHHEHHTGTTHEHKN